MCKDTSSFIVIFMQLVMNFLNVKIGINDNVAILDKNWICKQLFNSTIRIICKIMQVFF